MNKLVTLTIFIAALLLNASCSRPIEGHSRVWFDLPTEKLLSTSIPSDRKLCFGAQVRASDIPTRKTTCSPALGVTAGFTSGRTLTISTPSGADRVVDLYLYLGRKNEACPTWNEAFDSTGTHYARTYKVATSAPVNLSGGEAQVVLNFQFPGIEETVQKQLTLPTCASTTPQLYASLDSTGTISDAQGISLSLPAALGPTSTLSSFSKADAGKTTGTDLLILSNASVLKGGGLDQKLAPKIQSITTKPDNWFNYALLANGQIAAIDMLTGATTDLSLSCPFDAAGCKVPRWIQSISAGYGKRLFALDHAGNIYEVTATGLVATGSQVSPRVVQVAYY